MRLKLNFTFIETGNWKLKQNQLRRGDFLKYQSYLLFAKNNIMPL